MHKASSCPDVTSFHVLPIFSKQHLLLILQFFHFSPGYSANAEIVLAQAQKTLTIPESAIEFSGDSAFVYVVKGSGKQKTYERRQVTTGLSDGVNIEIKKGLTTKDKVRGPEMVADDEK